MDAEIAPAQGTAPTCYRHPGRETHIRCTRCDRPICPDCMISASVGFQCPECVREGNAGVREARTPFGGRISANRSYVSLLLIGINVLVFVAQRLVPTFESRFFLFGLALDGGGMRAAGVATGEWYRLLTAPFLHGNELHLLLNMYALFLFGPALEGMLGRARYLALYLLAALGGSATSYAFNAPTRPSLGASGAIFGLFAAYFVVSRRLGRDVTQLWVLLGINVVFGFVVPSIDWRAHFGGFVAGGLVALAMAYAPRSRRLLWQLAGSAAVAVLALTVVTVRTAELTGTSSGAVAACALAAPARPAQDFVGCLGGG